ncbi:hypothetical protein FHS41_004725 [Streptomyces violarus]|uniref:Uncharacterized protein n=1 Tax=Streptomyces violarus TaxID=67380 RepID=A0A7W4ZT75_9ACTN|nr:hypothetical protein [Streptomyces violarus]
MTKKCLQDTYSIKGVVRSISDDLLKGEYPAGANIDLVGTEPLQGLSKPLSHLSALTQSVIPRRVEDDQPGDTRSENLR